MELFHPARFIRASISLTQIPPSSTPIQKKNIPPRNEPLPRLLPRVPRFIAKLKKEEE